MPAARVRVQQADFDPGQELQALQAGRTDVGALVSFTGCVRGESPGEPVRALTLEHYPGMTEREIAGHVAEAERRWPLLGVTIIHRTGRLRPGEPIVLVAVAAAHRGEAFAACEFLMDYLKTRAPFWKEEQRGADTHWGEAKASDDAAAERWNR